MNILFIVLHVLSLLWLWKAWQQWRRFLLSNSLFVIFSGFILLANLSPYFAHELDSIAQFFGIELAVRAANYLSIIVLFVIVKHLYRHLRLQERKLARLARALAVQEFRASYLRGAEPTAK